MWVWFPSELPGKAGVRAGAELGKITKNICLKQKTNTYKKFRLELIFM